MTLVLRWARAFALTASLEAIVATPLLAARETPIPVRRRLGIVLCAQVMSHPAVWFIFPALGLSYAWTLVLAELWAVASELVLYRLAFPELGWSRALAASALANAASFGAWLLLR